MKGFKNDFQQENFAQEWATGFVNSIEKTFTNLANERTANVSGKLEKILNAFSKQGLGYQHFSSTSGYGHGDLGRDLIDRVFAQAFDAESAAVRMQFVSGTHAITSALFGSLRPGDSLLSITGRPYETLEEVIGIRGSGNGSLIEFGVEYEEISVFYNGTFDISRL